MTFDKEKVVGRQLILFSWICTSVTMARHILGCFNFGILGASSVDSLWSLMVAHSSEEGWTPWVNVFFSHHWNMMIASMSCYCLCCHYWRSHVSSEGPNRTCETTKRSGMAGRTRMKWPQEQSRSSLTIFGDGVVADLLLLTSDVRRNYWMSSY